jgi:FixJ family two-component response regulator
MISANAPISEETVFVVDDDEAVRDSMRWLLEGNGYRVVTFASAEAFLEMVEPHAGGCLIADIRMPGMSGLELQEVLVRRGSNLPLILITGHGDVPMAVESMKKGAFDFIEKPFNEADLRQSVSSCLAQHRTRRDTGAMGRVSDVRLARLTVREQQVLERIVAGRLNKQIADDLGISIKTVEAHRANIMEKLEVRSMADLMKIALRSGL